ncbi:MAG: peptide deformylase [Desulfovibrionales bacterium]|nr:peptide deformylase [Desulfovibrionales bacterium]
MADSYVNFMAIRKIITYPHPVLKQVAEPVKKITSEILALVADMAGTMYAAPGIGLAANQIGVLKRVLVFDLSREGENKKLTALINPEIIWAEDETTYEEACLSVVDYSAEVRRSARVKVGALNLEGQPVEVEGEGLLAICLQHEIDHLNGILYIDRISSLKRSLYKRRLKKILKVEAL